jgi:hypothetical protein
MSTNSLTPTPSPQELIDMVQYLTKTNEHLVEEYRKLEKEVKLLREAMLPTRMVCQNTIWEK